MARLANKQMPPHRQIRAVAVAVVVAILLLLLTIAHSIQTNRHHFFCPPLNCTKAYLPMPFFIVQIKCVHIHFRAIYYFHIQTNHRIRPTLNMMKNQRLPTLRLVWLWCWKLSEGKLISSESITCICVLHSFIFVLCWNDEEKSQIKYESVLVVGWLVDELCEANWFFSLLFPFHSKNIITTENRMLNRIESV